VGRPSRRSSFLDDLDAKFFAKRSSGAKAVEKPLRLEIPQTARHFHFSHSFNNTNLDDRDHFLENATASVASLRGLITSIPER
jgi:hypothetical protein